MHWVAVSCIEWSAQGTGCPANNRGATTTPDRDIIGSISEQRRSWSLKKADGIPRESVVRPVLCRARAESRRGIFLGRALVLVKTEVMEGPPIISEQLSPSITWAASATPMAEEMIGVPLMVLWFVLGTTAISFLLTRPQEG